MRYVELAIVAGILVVAIALYSFKYDTQHERDRIAELMAQIEAEETAIRVLQAEWSLLNQPERLQRLSERFLELEPLKADQIKEIADLPHRSDSDQMSELVQRSLNAPEPGDASLR